MLTRHDRRELLGIAREAIECSIRNTSLTLGRANADIPHPSCGVFVTIRLDQKLRGCIGYIESIRPLPGLVADVARKAALEDPRFPPLSLEELERAILEISILTPLCPLYDISEIEVGRHGIVLEQGVHRGLLLPQVAVENDWNREEFVQATARKAGLSPEAWRDESTKLFLFTTEVLTELDL